MLMAVLGQGAFKINNVAVGCNRIRQHECKVDIVCFDLENADQSRSRR